EADPGAFQQSAEPVARGALGRDIEEVQIARDESVLRFAPVGVDGREAGRPYAERAGGTELVVHQRDERRDDDTGARQRDGGKLVAERLAGPGRHDGECRATREDALDDLLLHAAIGLESEDAAKQGGWVGKHGSTLETSL